MESPSSNGIVDGQDKENLIAEMIFDWWVSGKSYSKWYADKYLQLSLDFEDDVTLTMIMLYFTLKNTNSIQLQLKSCDFSILSATAAKARYLVLIGSCAHSSALWQILSNRSFM